MQHAKCIVCTIASALLLIVSVSIRAQTPITIDIENQAPGTHSWRIQTNETAVRDDGGLQRNSNL